MISLLTGEFMFLLNSQAVSPKLEEIYDGERLSNANSGKAGPG